MIERMKDPLEREKVSKNIKALWATPEFRAKRSGINHPFFGKCGAESHTAKVVITPLGRFDTATEAARAEGIPLPSMYTRCRGELEAYSQTYYYEDVGPVKLPPPKRVNTKAVSTPLGVFDAAMDAAKAHGVKLSTFYEWCRDSKKPDFKYL